MTETAAGVALAAGSAAAFEASYLVQASQVRLVPGKERGGRLLRTLIVRRWWLAGIGLMAAAFFCELLALQFVPLTVVQPLLALGLLLLVALTPRVLGERVRPIDLAAAAAIGTGAVAVVAGAPPHGTPIRSLPLAIGIDVVLAVVLVFPQLARLPRTGMFVAGAAAGDVLVALATNEVARAGTDRVGLAALWVLVVAGAGLTAIINEATALQRLPASRVAPIITGAQVVLPVVIVALTLHVRWAQATGEGWLLAAGVVLVALGAVRLGAFGGELRAGPAGRVPV